MGHKRSKADLCLCFKWTTAFGLIIWLSWVDDCYIAGKKEGVMKAKNEMMGHFECDDVGVLRECVGCKINYEPERGHLKITQPVLLQSFNDEFNLPDGKASSLPAPPGEVLVKGKEGEELPSYLQSACRSGVGKLLYLAKWSRPEIKNRVRELSRFMTEATTHHLNAMHKLMKHCVSTPKRGLLLCPSGHWDGSPDFEHAVHGKSDSDYAKDPETRRSVGGRSTCLNDSPVVRKSNVFQHVTLSATESELASATHCAQDMLFVMRTLESMGLKVKKPMLLCVDNKGAKDLANNWSCGGRTRHVEVRQYFLRELKELDLMHTAWQSGDDNETDLCAKNLGGAKFEKHTSVYCGTDEHMKSDSQLREGVRGE